MENKWIEFKYGEMLPPERRYVLVARGGILKEYIPPSVSVGYLRYAAGDVNCPQFIVPGVGAAGGIVTHWCDCLGDDFKHPLWNSKQENRGFPARRWNYIRYNFSADLGTWWFKAIA